MWSGDNWGRKVDREWDKIRQSLTEKVTPEQRPGRSEKIVFHKKNTPGRGRGKSTKTPRSEIWGCSKKAMCLDYSQ